MYFAFTDEQQMIAETARAFFSENATSQRTRAAMAAKGVDAGIDRALWSAFCTDLGLSGIGVPEALGGAGRLEQKSRGAVAADIVERLQAAIQPAADDH